MQRERHHRQQRRRCGGEMERPEMDRPWVATGQPLARSARGTAGCRRLDPTTGRSVASATARRTRSPGRCSPRDPSGSCWSARQKRTRRSRRRNPDYRTGASWHRRTLASAADDPPEALGVPGHRAPDARGGHRRDVHGRSDVPAAGRCRRSSGARGSRSVDTWTFTAAGLPWFDQQWGAQVLLAAVYQVAGWTGLVLLRGWPRRADLRLPVRDRAPRGVSGCAERPADARRVRRRAPALALRPQLGRDGPVRGHAAHRVGQARPPARRSGSSRFSSRSGPTCMAASSSARSSVGLAWLEDVHERVAQPASGSCSVAIVSVAAACLTPFGPAVWGYAVGLSTNPSVTARITEWQRDLAARRRRAPVLRLGPGGRGAHRPARPAGRVADAPVAGRLPRASGPMPFAASRGGRWRPCPSSRRSRARRPPRPRASRRRTHRRRRLTRRLNGFVAGVFLLAGIAALPVWRPVDPGTGAPVGVLRDAPPGVTTAVRAQVRPGARLFNPQPWGSWFEFAVPDLLVAIDSRIELFPAQVWDDYAAVVGGREGGRRSSTGGPSRSCARGRQAMRPTRRDAAGSVSATPAVGPATT